MHSQLQSILSQTKLPDELIICDDRSSDSTISICEQVLANAPFKASVIVNEQTLRSTANFEKAISLCEGDIVVLCDQDDFWVPHKLEQIYNWFESNPDCGGVFSNGLLVDDKGNSLNTTLWDKFRFNERKKEMVLNNKGFKALLEANFITGATFAFKKDIVLKSFPIPYKWVHDYWIGAWVAVVSSLMFIDENLIHYRIHASQQLGIGQTQVTGIAGKLARLSFYWNKLRNFNDKYKYKEVAEGWREFSDLLKRHNKDISPIFIFQCEEAYKHLMIRGSLPSNILRRIPFIIKETLNLRYFRYSKGVISIVRDLFSI